MSDSNNRLIAEIASYLEPEELEEIDELVARLESVDPTSPSFGSSLRSRFAAREPLDQAPPHNLRRAVVVTVIPGAALMLLVAVSLLGAGPLGA